MLNELGKSDWQIHRSTGYRYELHLLIHRVVSWWRPTPCANSGADKLTSPNSWHCRKSRERTFRWLLRNKKKCKSLEHYYVKAFKSAPLLDSGTTALTAVYSPYKKRTSPSQGTGLEPFSHLMRQENLPRDRDIPWDPWKGLQEITNETWDAGRSKHVLQAHYVATGPSIFISQPAREQTTNVNRRIA